MLHQPTPRATSSAASTASSFRPPLDEVRGPYRVGYARTAADVDACCRVRYEVFNLELGEGLAESERTGLDRDRFDELCHHLMVIDESSGRVIGTYRMQTSEQARAGVGYYSAEEFDLSRLPESLEEQAIELGRACIAKQHRNKVVFFLLWRGLVAYLHWNRKRYLFGCSSLTSQDPEEGLRAYDWLLRKGYVREEFETPPRIAYECVVDGHVPFKGRYEIPKLFGMYLRNGAKICGPPALDRYFGTIDFLTMLDIEQADRRLVKALAAGLAER